MHNYTLDTNNNIEKHLQQIQSIKSRLIRNNFLRVIEKQNELIAKLNNIVEITHKSLEVLMKNGDILI